MNLSFARPIIAFLLAASLAGCGSTSSTSTQTDASNAPSLAPQADAQSYSHGHRHHRHGHHASAYGAAGAGAGSSAAVARAPQAPASGGTWPCNDAQFLSVQNQFASGSLQGDREVDICGNVTAVLAERDTRSGLHGYYYIQVAPGNTIEVVSDLGEMNAPAWPWVKVGDYSYVQGRYYYDSPSSQGVDWTHHGTSRSWPSAGFVVVNGTQYQ